MTASPVEVLVVGDGDSVHTRRHAEALSDRGISVGVAAFEGAPIARLDWTRLGSLPFTADRRYLLAIPPLAGLIRRRRPAIVHAHYLSSYGLMAALALRLGYPVGRRPLLVQSTWGADLLVTARASRLRARMAAFALREARLATGDSVDLDEEIARLAPSVPRARFAWGPPRRLFETPISDQPRMVVARRLDPQMRVDLAVRGFVAARRHDSIAMAGWRLDVVGDGPDRALVEAAAGAESSVTLHGRLELGQLRDLLAQSRVLINVPAADATSAILLDGLAMGLLPVVNDLPAYAEWIDRSIGEVVERDPSAESLGAAIVRATKRVVDPERIRDRARTVEWERQVDSLLDAYRRAGWSG